MRELNYAVQMTIDRIVFLRICEDRGIERDEQLKEISAAREIFTKIFVSYSNGQTRAITPACSISRDEKGQSSGPDSVDAWLEDR